MNNDLFNNENLQEAVEKYSISSEIILKIKSIATNFSKENLSNEETQQAPFLIKFFGEILGYSWDGVGKSLWWEAGSKVDGKKPDGILGFNVTDFENATDDIRVVIELKDDKKPLDKPQNRAKDNRTPIEQAFGYASKVGGKCEWVIVSNFRTIRLYRFGDESKFHEFTLSELSNNDEKAKEFHFLLANGRLFTKVANQSPTHKLAIEMQEAGETIEERFYRHYSSLRTTIKENLTALNQEKKYTKQFYLYKAQKLIDRIIFIRFCRENGALDNDAVVEVLNNEWAGETKYERMKALFNAMDKGKPQIGIAKFNGGLFAPDEDLDNLLISNEVIDKIVQLYQYDFGSDLDVNILGHIFEQSITDIEIEIGSIDDERKEFGIVYTPQEITDFVIEQTIGEIIRRRAKKIQAKENSQEWWQDYAKIVQGLKVVDPSCGSGAFLVRVFDFFEKKHREIEKHVKTGWNYEDILINNIFGVDINPASVGITKLSLWLRTAHHRKPLTTLDGNIKIGDSLISSDECAGSYLEIEGKNVSIQEEKQLEIGERWDEKFTKSLAFKWHGEFSQVFANGGFDVVVGNPPYVRHELIKAKQKQELSKKYRVHCGGADLYCYFYEKATSILKYEGVLGFITSNKWMRAKYGEKLRVFFLENTKINILLDLAGQKIFKGVGVDANIIVYTKTQENKENYQFFAGTSLQGGWHEFESKNLEKTCFNVLANDGDRQVKAKMEKIGTPLKDWNVKINYGIKTGFNEAFIIDTKTKEAICKEDANSAEIIKPVLRGRDICRYGYEWAGLWVIFSRRGTDIEKYPAIKKHLMQFYDQIRPKNNGEKTGRKPGPYQWFEIQDNVAYYEDFAREKVVWAETANEMKFTIDSDGKLIDKTCFIMTGENLKFLLLILASQISKFYISSIASGLGENTLSFSKIFIEQLPIPKIDAKTQEPFVKMAEKMLELTAKLNGICAKLLKLLQADLGVGKITRKLESWHELELAEFFSEISKQNKGLSLSQKSDWADHFETQKSAYKTLQAQISKLDGEINAMVYKLYELTDEEIKIVESN